jgi:hypothetical protein
VLLFLLSSVFNVNASLIDVFFRHSSNLLCMAGFSRSAPRSDPQWSDDELFEHARLMRHCWRRFVPSIGQLRFLAILRCRSVLPVWSTGRSGPEPEYARLWRSDLKA